MECIVNHNAMAAVGYAVPWSSAPGKNVELHVSCERPPVSVGISRLDLPVPCTVDWPVVSVGQPPVKRSFSRGSFIRVARDALCRSGEFRSLSFELLLTRNQGQRTVLSMGALCLALVDGTLTWDDGSRRHVVATDVPNNTWLDVTVWKDARSVGFAISADDNLAPWHVETTIHDAWVVDAQGDLLLAAGPDNTQPTLNCKIAALRLETAAGSATWNFPTRLTTDAILSQGDLELAAELFNLPTFCTRSRRWDGTSFDPKHVPSQYDALHFHDDDMGAFDWPPSYRVTIPGDAEPGVYAFDVDLAERVERIVFFVSSTRSQRPVLFVVPTATYLAYADELLPREHFEWQCEDRGHRFIEDNQLRSLYDFHNDLSGVSICSYKKPKVTLRDDYDYPLCGCPHNLPVDLHLLRFLQANGIDYDLVTDHDLHHAGAACFDACNVVVTGSHPEYMSVEMEGAFRQFVARGGNLAYLGGNGFSTVAAFHRDLMELRRSPLEAGRTWDGAVADQTLAITNEPGGYLRNRGRGEFSLIGVAISLMGFEKALPYQRTPVSHEPEFDWLFDSVTGETFGATGMVLGGVAGYEVDATDEHLGTSPDTVVLARATDFPASHFHDPSRWYEGGEPEIAEHRCAEMTLRACSAGGIIFSASSVAWCGALPEGGDMNDVGRITMNLLQRLATRARAVTPQRSSAQQLRAGPSED